MQLIAVCLYKVQYNNYFIQIEEALIQRKKMELLQKYVSDDLQAEEEESKKMLGL